MNAKNFIAAAAVFLSTASAFAAEAPAAASAASSTSTTSPTSTASTTSGLNLPTLGAPSRASRDEVKAEAADLVKDYRTTLSVQLDQYKN